MKIKFLDGTEKDFADLGGAYLRAADLRGADLGGADLRNANLRGAYLRGADLQAADLREADLREADLGGAYLRAADLRGAYLRAADLQAADLRGAYLQEADLRGAYLRAADLGGAYLRAADLQAADLREADLREADLPHFQIVPSQGALVAWKKCIEGVIKIEIPANAQRTSTLVGRKCRAEFVRTLELPEGVDVAKSKRNPGVTYAVGEITRADSYDPDIRVECSPGIHFFMTRQEAEEY